MIIDQKVIAILEAGKCEDLLFFLPDTQLERKLYVSVNKVLVDLGGKWNRGKQAHVFTISPADIIDEICITGEYTSRKKELQFFETPEDIARDLVEYADIQPGEMVLEPSAGHGRIAKLLPYPLCIEIDKLNCEVLRGKGIPCLEFDFMDDKCLQGFELIDVVVANPPFTKQQDIDHVTKMISLAQRRVVAIMSASMLWRDNVKAVQFRQLIGQYDYDIIELSEGAFKESGTNIKTVILVLDTC